MHWSCDRNDVVDLKWQNRFKVVTEKPKLCLKSRCSQYRMTMSGKTSWKTTLWACNEKYIQTGTMLYLPAGRLRSGPATGSDKDDEETWRRWSCHCHTRQQYKL